MNRRKSAGWCEERTPTQVCGFADARWGSQTALTPTYEAETVGWGEERTPTQVRGLADARWGSQTALTPTYEAETVGWGEERTPTRKTAGPVSTGRAGPAIADDGGLKSALQEYRGFTLIETVLVIVILGILAGAMAPLLSGGLTAYTELNEATATMGKLRYALERMARELRQVDYNDATGNFEIATMTAGTLSFTKSDGVTVTLTSSGAIATLQYYDLGSLLWDPVVASTLTDQLNTLAFDYYQADGITAATSNADVAFVQIRLTLTEGGNSYPQRTRVSLRNLQ